jgi:hypothetical protein
MVGANISPAVRTEELSGEGARCDLDAANQLIGQQGGQARAVAADRTSRQQPADRACVWTNEAHHRGARRVELAGQRQPGRRHTAILCKVLAASTGNRARDSHHPGWLRNQQERSVDEARQPDRRAA